jgi:TolB-like protein
MKRLKSRKIPAAITSVLEKALAVDSNRSPGIAACLAKELKDCFSEIQAVQPYRKAWRWKKATLVTVGAAVAVFVATLVPKNVEKNERSIALLPFKTVSDNSADALLAEEIEDDIRTRLVGIRDIKVIKQFEESTHVVGGKGDFRKIGRKLGVRYLLEGSVHCGGDKLRLDVSLVHVSKNHSIWSHRYDGRLADALNLQGELATDVAEAVKAKLSAPDRTNVSVTSSKKSDAYALFVQGRRLENNPAFAVSSYEEAEAVYRQAIALDPSYGLAHARLAITAGLLYRFRKPTQELRAVAESEANEAVRLSPESGEAHLAMGLYYYRVKRDYEYALPELTIAQRLLRNDTEAEVTIAFIHRRQGLWSDARAEQENLLTRDPQNQEYEHELHATACLLRDWQGALQHAARAVTLAPQLVHLRGEKALVPYWKSGDLKPLHEFFERLPGFGDEEGNLTWSRWDAAMLARDFPAALFAVKGFPRETLPAVGNAPIPQSYLEGCVLLAQGQKDNARQAFEIARPVFEAEVKTSPNDALRHARLGLLYAYIGRREDALREGKKAIEITPVSKDAVDGHQWVCNLALIHARVGEADEAINMIESLLTQPGCVSPLNEACMTLWDLRLRWQWDPLRKDPRFQKILAGFEPKTIY